MATLDHERLHVYQAARELSREVHRLVKDARPGRHDLTDQLRRAAASVPLNLAEGTGEDSPARRAYFYRIARSSATEVAAALDHAVDVDLLDQDATHPAKDLTVRIVAMLFRLTNSVKTSDSYPPLPRPPRLRPRHRP